MTTPVYVGSTTGPIPGAVAWMLVTITYSDDGHTRQTLFRWTDHTAASVRDYWRKRFRNHGVDHQWAGGDLITVRPMSDGVTVTERRTFHDAMPVPADAVAESLNAALAEERERLTGGPPGPKDTVVPTWREAVAHLSERGVW